jgi:hypothetical protein
MPGNGNPQKQFSGSKQPISEPGKMTSMNTKESLPRRDSFKKHREGQFQPSYRGQKSVGLLRSTVRSRVPPTEFSKHRLRFPTLRACLKVSCLSEAVEHKACCDECHRALHAVPVILAQSAIAAKPSEDCARQIHVRPVKTTSASARAMLWPLAVLWKYRRKPRPNRYPDRGDDLLSRLESRCCFKLGRIYEQAGAYALRKIFLWFDSHRWHHLRA